MAENLQITRELIKAKAEEIVDWLEEYENNPGSESLDDQRADKQNSIAFVIGTLFNLPREMDEDALYEEGREREMSDQRDRNLIEESKNLERLAEGH